MLAIYCRISKDSPKQTSTDTQKQLGKKFAKDKGFDTKIYTDKDVSGGAKVENRPSFNNMLNDITDGLINAVYIYNQDRAERDEVTWFNLAQFVIENEIDLYENGILIELDNPDVYMLHGMKSIINSHFRRITSKKIRTKLKLNAQENKAHGILPYGYKKGENGKIEIDLVEIKNVKRIFKLSLEGKGIQLIANMFNKENISTRYNTFKGTIKTTNKYTNKSTIKQKADVKWSSKTVHDILKNTWYKGVRTFNKIKYEIPELAIFDEYYWNSVQVNLIKNKNYSGTKKKYKYLLKGIIRCAKCDRNFYGRTRQNKKDNFYMCSSKRYPEHNCKNRSINIDVLDDFIWSRFFIDDILKNKIIKHFTNNNTQILIESLRDQINELKIDLNRVEIEKQKAIKLTVKGIISEDDIQGELKRIEVEKNKIIFEISNAKEQLNQNLLLLENKDNLLSDFDTLKSTTSLNDKQEIIKKYIKEIRISNEFEDFKIYSVEIYFNIDLEPEVYLIGYQYHYAIEYFSEIIIPLSERFKNIEQDKLEQLSQVLIHNFRKELYS